MLTLELLYEISLRLSLFLFTLKKRFLVLKLSVIYCSRFNEGQKLELDGFRFIKHLYLYRFKISLFHQVCKLYLYEL
jgi:hypothetical protein